MPSRIVAAELVDSEGRPVAGVEPNAALKLRLTYSASVPVGDITLGFLVHRSTDGLVVYDGNVRGTEIGLIAFAPGEKITVEFAFCAHLTRGLYHLEGHVLHNPTRRFLARLRPAAHFTVSEDRTFAGIADVELAAVMVDRTTS